MHEDALQTNEKGLWGDHNSGLLALGPRVYRDARLKFEEELQDGIKAWLEGGRTQKANTTDELCTQLQVELFMKFFEKPRSIE